MNNPQPVAHCEHCCQCEPCANSRALHDALMALWALSDAFSIKDMEWATRAMDDLDAERVINHGLRAAEHYDELSRATLA